MRTFGIDFGMEPPEEDSPGDPESNRTSFDTFEMTGESLMWPLFKHFFQRFFRLTPPPMRQAGIQASNSMKPLIGARLGTIVYGFLFRRPPKYWLPLRRGWKIFLNQNFVSLILLALIFLKESKQQKTYLLFDISAYSRSPLRVWIPPISFDVLLPNKKGNIFAPRSRHH